MYADRVKEMSSSTGTGALTLTGAVSGFRTVTSQYATGAQGPFLIQNGATEWEVSLCTWTGTALTRDVVLSSSNAGALVSFTAGPMVASDLPAANIADVGTTYGMKLGIFL